LIDTGVETRTALLTRATPPLSHGMQTLKNLIKERTQSNE